MASVTIRSDFRNQEEEICHYFHLFPFYLSWSNGAGCHDLSFLIFSFKPVLSLSSFPLIQRLLSSSSLSAITVVSSVYLRLLMFLPSILISACNLSSPAFLMVCSAYKLNRVTADSLAVLRLLAPSWANQLFHTRFLLQLLGPHTGFSGDS